MTDDKKKPDEDDDPRWPNTMRHHKWEKKEPKADEPPKEAPPAEPQADGWGQGR